MVWLRPSWYNIFYRNALTPEYLSDIRAFFNCCFPVPFSLHGTGFGYIFRLWKVLKSSIYQSFLFLPKAENRIHSYCSDSSRNNWYWHHSAVSSIYPLILYWSHRLRWLRTAQIQRQSLQGLFFLQYLIFPEGIDYDCTHWHKNAGHTSDSYNLSTDFQLHHLQAATRSVYQ